MAIFEIAKNGIWSKKIFVKLILFDFTIFFTWTFLNFLAHSANVSSSFSTLRTKILLFLVLQIFPPCQFQAIFILMLLGWLFVPVYHASGVFTMPEYMKKRFGHQRIRVLLSILSLIIYVLTKLSVIIYHILKHILHKTKTDIQQ